MQSHCGAVVEKRTKARGPGHPHRMTKVMRTPTTAYNIDEWMEGLEEDAPKVEARNGNVINCRPEWRNAHPQCAGQVSKLCRRQGRPQLPRNTSGGSPSSGMRVLIGEAIEVPSSQHDESVWRK